MLVTYLAWALIGASVFLAVFYMNIFWRTRGETVDTAQQDAHPPISILMPAYNEERTVETALDNALTLDYPDHEVIFVDDGSTDDTLALARQFADHDRLRIIEHGDNQGKAAALNTALDAADSEYVVVQDADSRIDEGTLEAAAARFMHNDDLGAVIASIRPLATDNFIRKLQAVQYRITNFYRSLMAHIDTIDVTPGAFSMYRKADLETLGGFDVGNPTEDLEIAWRLRRLGREIDMVYDRSSSTEYPPTFRELYHQRVTWARGSIRNAWKHRDMFFDDAYGWFGVFQLPVHIISPLIAITSLLLIATGLGEQAYSLLLHVSAVGISLPTIQAVDWTRLLIGVQWKVYAPLGLSMVVTAYLIRTAYRTAGDAVEHPVALGAYFLAFFALYGFFWTAAIIKELLHTGRVWTWSRVRF
ncbi:MAG: glycosyltransferase [Candidatus Nanohaloarchaea archaeon]|nr:glycosyltransferase [Candidatus Nanohaloarchaea archaeon]